MDILKPEPKIIDYAQALEEFYKKLEIAIQNKHDIKPIITLIQQEFTAYSVFVKKHLKRITCFA